MEAFSNLFDVVAVLKSDFSAKTLAWSETKEWVYRRCILVATVDTTCHEFHKKSFLADVDNSKFDLWLPPMVW